MKKKKTNKKPTYDYTSIVFTELVGTSTTVLTTTYLLGSRVELHNHRCDIIYNFFLFFPFFSGQRA